MIGSLGPTNRTASISPSVEHPEERNISKFDCAVYGKRDLGDVSIIVCLLCSMCISHGFISAAFDELAEAYAEAAEGLLVGCLGIAYLLAQIVLSCLIDSARSRPCCYCRKVALMCSVWRQSLTP